MRVSWVPLGETWGVKLLQSWRGWCFAFGGHPVVEQKGVLYIILSCFSSSEKVCFGKARVR